MSSIHNQCIAITLNNTRCSNSASCEEYCGIHVKNKLPNDISDLIGMYEEEEKYTNKIINTNPKVRKEIINEELENIELDHIIKFKLSMQLADNYIKKQNKKIDPIVVAGIYLPLLNIYSYDELLNPNKDVVAEYNGYLEKVEEYIDIQLIYLKSTANIFFYNVENDVYPFLSKNYLKK